MAELGSARAVVVPAGRRVRPLRPDQHAEGAWLAWRSAEDVQKRRAELGLPRFDPSIPWREVAMLLGSAVGVAALVRALRQQRRATRDLPPADYRRALRMLARRGLLRSPIAALISNSSSRRRAAGAGRGCRDADRVVSGRALRRARTDRQRRLAAGSIASTPRSTPHDTGSRALGTWRGPASAEGARRPRRAGQSRDGFPATGAPSWRSRRTASRV
jgi:hypothetical protein